MAEQEDLSESLLGRWLIDELDARAKAAPANDIEEGRLEAVLTLCRLIGPGPLGQEADDKVKTLLTPKREHAMFLRWRSAALAAAVHQPVLDDISLGYIHAVLGIAVASERGDDPPAATALATRWMEDPRLQALDARFDMTTRHLTD